MSGELAGEDSLVELIANRNLNESEFNRQPTSNLYDDKPTEKEPTVNNKDNASPDEIAPKPENTKKKRGFSKKEKDKKNIEYPAINPIKLIRFMNKFDALLLIIGVISAVIQGAAFPITFLALGEAFISFFSFQANIQSCTNNPVRTATDVSGNIRC